MVSCHYDRHLRVAGLKNTQLALLSLVVALGPIRPGQLAKCMQMDASTLTRNMQPLVAQGWLVIGRGNDARSRLVHVTEAGRAKRAEGQRHWKLAQMALGAELGTQGLAALHALLDTCTADLHDPAGHGAIKVAHSGASPKITGRPQQTPI